MTLIGCEQSDGYAIDRSNVVGVAPAAVKDPLAAADGGVRSTFHHRKGLLGFLVTSAFSVHHSFLTLAVRGKDYD